MKKTLHILTVMLFGIAVFTTSGCTKEGPAGPAGNANVTARTFSATSWSWSSPYYYTDFTVPELTSSTINSAAVMVYFGTSSNTWFALPYTQYNSPADYYMGFVTTVNRVEVNWVYDSSLSSGSDPNSYYGTTLQYKVVVIPKAERMANPDLDLTDYEAVKARFQLAD